MAKSELSAGEARLKHSNRYGPEAQAEAETRHRLYLEVRGHLLAGWDGLPDGLTKRNLRELAVMAKARSDHRIHTLCRNAGGDVPTSMPIAPRIAGGRPTARPLP